MNLSEFITNYYCVTNNSGERRISKSYFDWYGVEYSDKLDETFERLKHKQKINMKIDHEKDFETKDLN